MPTLDAKLQTGADTALDALVTALQTLQAGVKSAAGRYRQCRPSDKASWGTWETQKPDAAAVQNVRVDEYLSGETFPPIPGYVVCGELTDGDGVIWRRCIHVAGPEGWREAAWQPESKEAA